MSWCCEIRRNAIYLLIPLQLTQFTRIGSKKMSSADVKEDSPKGPSKTHKSSVVIIPPENVWKQIQDIREKHDKSFKRWMPHINLLYPFYHDNEDGSTFIEARSKLTAGLSQLKPFTVTFDKDSFGFFVHKKNCTMWLKPIDINVVRALNSDLGAATGNMTINCSNSDDKSGIDESLDGGNDIDKSKEPTDVTDYSHSEEFQAISNVDDIDCSTSTKDKKKKKISQKEKANMFKLEAENPFIPYQKEVTDLQTHLEGVYPECSDLREISGTFKPHLSLGQFDKNTVQKDIERFKSDWQDISFEVSEVYMISRKDFDDPFHIRHAIPIGGSDS